MRSPEHVVTAEIFPILIHIVEHPNIADPQPVLRLHHQHVVRDMHRRQCQMQRQARLKALVHL